MDKKRCDHIDEGVELIKKPFSNEYRRTLRLSISGQTNVSVKYALFIENPEASRVALRMKDD